VKLSRPMLAMLSAGVALLVLAVPCAGAETTGSAALGADLFVAPDGDDSNPGTREEPFGSVANGNEELAVHFWAE